MKVIVTGAAGFIGGHAAAAWLGAGDSVVGIDNLSRRGTTENLAWLRGLGGQFELAEIDIRDRARLEAVFEQHSDADVVLHAAGQVAVTTSVADPRTDFEINALGTLNVLEAMRRHTQGAGLIFTSTNKVYGQLEDKKVVDRNGRYEFGSGAEGVDEAQPLDFHSPYGCSKGSADQYVRDYSRIYGLRTVVLRQSCVYGSRQFGVEDQGWVAWFVIAAVLGRPLTIYGDGKQVRDVLWVGDLTDLFLRVAARIDSISGSIYNVGGGTFNLSLLELVEMLERSLDRRVERSHADWRPGDQKVFVSNIGKLRDELGWEPKVAPAEGVERLVEWVGTARSELTSVLG